MATTMCMCAHTMFIKIKKKYFLLFRIFQWQMYGSAGEKERNGNGCHNVFAVSLSCVQKEMATKKIHQIIQWRIVSRCAYSIHAACKCVYVMCVAVVFHSNNGVISLQLYVLWRSRLQLKIGFIGPKWKIILIISFEALLMLCAFSFPLPLRISIRIALIFLCLFWMSRRTNVSCRWVWPCQK